MNRRFLNLVLRCTGEGYSLHRPDTWGHLFYKSAAAATAAAAATTKGIFEQEQGSSLGGIPGIGIGTYAFSTVTQGWRKAGDWSLPFEDNAEHVPEFGLWVGLLSCAPYHLCAVGSLRAPAVQYVWHWQDFDTPEHLLPIKQYLVYLGLGRFSTAKIFHDLDNDYVAVFTGVELIQDALKQFLGQFIFTTSDRVPEYLQSFTLKQLHPWHPPMMVHLFGGGCGIPADGHRYDRCADDRAVLTGHNFMALLTDGTDSGEVILAAADGCTRRR
ncbi:hypothetical protein BAE44_0000968 [Dichanthelium oligosanthes]|uniref:Uncharacterized protein n=1 Tax=Dichanthelium oligosanthes TaxID=888268 RepID=A0A1E5WKS7_9POAL|nr:hypothetical protein BAE44_0000968 [Dichanthelium oligosanthes]